MERADIVRKCTEAVVACFNHYSDKSLCLSIARQIGERLDQLLPDVIETNHWQIYVEEYQRESEEEDTRED